MTGIEGQVSYAHSSFTCFSRTTHSKCLHFNDTAYLMLFICATSILVVFWLHRKIYCHCCQTCPNFSLRPMHWNFHHFAWRERNGSPWLHYCHFFSIDFADFQVNRVLLYHKSWQANNLAMKLTRSQQKKIRQWKREAAIHCHRRVHATYYFVKVDMQRVT